MAVPEARCSNPSPAIAVVNKEDMNETVNLSVNSELETNEASLWVGGDNFAIDIVITAEQVSISIYLLAAHTAATDPAVVDLSPTGKCSQKSMSSSR